MVRRKRACPAALLACAVTVSATVSLPAARAQSSQELALFLSAETAHRDFSAGPDSDDTDLLASADVLYSFSGERFRFLAEYLWSSNEAELERLTLGWRTDSRTTVWLGRVHQPGRFWTTEYHHGQYLQTTISRPWIEEWEDDGGALTSHVTGALVQTEYSGNDNALVQLELATGLSPNFTGAELSPVDLLDFESGHDLGVSASATYVPDFAKENQFGVMGSWMPIDVEADAVPSAGGIRRVDQTSAGAFVDWTWDRWGLLAAGYYVHYKLERPASRDTEQFYAAYAQVAYRQNDSLAWYGRAEVNDISATAAFVEVLPIFETSRHVLGVRWDFAPQHALTAEIIRSDVESPGTLKSDVTKLALQWSAVFP